MTDLLKSYTCSQPIILSCMYNETGKLKIRKCGSSALRSCIQTPNLCFLPFAWPLSCSCNSPQVRPSPLLFLSHSSFCFPPPHLWGPTAEKQPFSDSRGEGWGDWWRCREHTFHRWPYVCMFQCMWNLLCYSLCGCAAKEINWRTQETGQKQFSCFLFYFVGYSPDVFCFTSSLCVYFCLF